MTRIELIDRIAYCQKEMIWLEKIVTNCHSCMNKEFNRNVCQKYGEIPEDFIEKGCDDWLLDDVPF